MVQIATVLNLSTSIISTWGNIGDLAEKVKKHTTKFIHNTFTEWVLMQGGWVSRYALYVNSDKSLVHYSHT